MTANLQNPIFTDETKAREWLEARVWPHGPVCPHCGVTSEYVTKLDGAKSGVAKVYEVRPLRVGTAERAPCRCGKSLGRLCSPYELRRSHRNML